MLRYFLLVILVVSVFFQSKVVIADDKLTDGPKSEFSAKVNYKDWEAGVVGCNVHISDVEIFGFGMDNNGITIKLDGPPREGTFEISKKSKNKASYGSKETNYIIGANDIGKVIITKYDAEKKLFAGSFELNLTDAKTGKKVTITDGVFSNLAFFDPPKSKNKLEVKLNGLSWKYIAFSTYSGKDSIDVTAFDDKQALLISIPQNITIGEYILNDKGLVRLELKKRDFTEYMDVKRGRLVILENDTKGKRINGQFEFEAEQPAGKDKAKFTKGEFSIFYW